MGAKVPQYDYWSGDAPHPTARYLFPAIFDLLPPNLPRPSRVIDVGCGNGALAARFIERGDYVVGVDPGEAGIEIARAAHPAGRFEVMAAREDLLDALGEDPFDIAVSTEVIEHLYDPGAFLDACNALLRPRGVLLLSTPYHGYLKNLALAVTGRHDAHHHSHRVGGHIKFFSEKTLARLLGEHAFADVRFVGVGRLPYLWKSMVVCASRP